MFNSPVIDLVILLSFVYFISSLILSAINEAIAGAFRLPKQQSTTKATTDTSKQKTVSPPVSNATNKPEMGKLGDTTRRDNCVQPISKDGDWPLIFSPDLSPLSVVLVALGLGIAPYAFNKVSGAIVSNKSEA